MEARREEVGGGVALGTRGMRRVIVAAVVNVRYHLLVEIRLRRVCLHNSNRSPAALNPVPACSIRVSLRVVQWDSAEWLGFEPLSPQSTCRL